MDNNENTEPNSYKFAHKRAFVSQHGDAQSVKKVHVEKKAASALVEVETVMKLPVAGNLNAQVFASSTRICVLIGSTVNLVDLSTGKLLATIRLDCEVAVGSFTHDSTFFVVADTLGALHFIHMQSCSIAFSQDIGVKNLKQMHLSEKGGLEFMYFLSSTGHILIFKNMDMAALNNALLSRDSSLASDVRQKILFKRFDLKDLNQSAPEAFAVAKNQTIYVAFENAQIIQFDEGKTFVKRIAAPPDLKARKCVVTEDDKFLITVFNDGSLVVFDARRLIALKFVDNGIDDFFLLSIQGTLHILCHEQSTDSVALLEFPSLKQKMELIKSALCPSFNMSLNHTGSVFGCVEDGFVNIVVIKESTPITKYHNLIAKRKFEEAEKLAKEHGFSFDELLESQLNDFLGDTILDEDVEQICKLFEKSENPTKIVQFLKECVCADFQTINNLSFSAFSTVTASSNKHEMINLSVFIKTLSTYQMLSHEAFDPKKWRDFLNMPRIETLEWLLAQGFVKKGQVLVNRHLEELNLEISLESLLNSLPLRSDVTSILEFLKQSIIPNVSQPNEVLVQWIQKRARSMEEQNGIAARAFRFLDELLNELVSKRYGSMNDIVDELYYTEYRDMLILRNQLRDLVQLADKHDYYISLSDYSRENPSVVALALLDRVTADEVLQEAIDEHFRTFCKLAGVSDSELLMEYAAELMDSMTFARVMILGGRGDSADWSWIPRVCLLLENISEIDLKLGTILEVLRRSPIPWPEEIEAIITSTQALSIDGSKKFSDFNEQVRFMKLKRMLLKYGFQSFNISDLDMAQNAMKTIVERNYAHSLFDDALQLVDAYHHLRRSDVYVLHLEYLARTGEFKDINSVIPQIPSDISLPIIEEFFLWIETCYDFYVELTRDQKNVPENILLHLCESALKVGACVSEMSERSLVFERLESLISSYGMVLTLTEWRSEKVKSEMMLEHCKEYFKQSGKDPILEIHTGNYYLLKLASLLNIDSTQLYEILAKVSLNSGNTKRAQIIYDHIISSDTEDDKIATILVRIVEDLMGRAPDLIKNDRNLPEVLRSLASTAVGKCSADNLLRTLDLWKVVETFCEALHQTDHGAYLETIADNDENSDMKNEISKALFSEFYFDDYLVMDVDENRDLLEELSSLRLTRSDEGGNGKSAEKVSNNDMILQRLSDNRSYQLAARLSDLMNVHLSYKSDIFDVKQLLLKNVDGQLAFGYMISLPHKVAFDCLKQSMASINRDFQRLTKLAGIGASAALMWQQRAFYVQLETLAKNSRWWEQLILLELDFEEDQFRHSDEYRRSYVAKLLQKSGYDVYFVLDYANDYDIESDFVFMQMINCLLLNAYDRDYRDLIAAFKDDIVNKEKYLNTLKDVQQYISPYDYERIRFVFELISQGDEIDTIAKTGCLILDILSGYKRKHVPTSSETETVLERIHSSNMIVGDFEEERYMDKSEESLPYHDLIYDPWAVLEKELDENSVGYLVPLAIPLELNADEFYLNIVDGLFKRDANVINLQTVKSLLTKVKELKAVFQCWLRLADSSSGSMRGQALRMALTSAEKLMRESRNQDEEMISSYDIITEMVKEADVTSILEDQGLTKYSELAKDPEELIRRLYAEMPFGKTHDLSLAVSECFDCDIGEVRAKLFTDWMKVTPTWKTTESNLQSVKLRDSRYSSEDDLISKLSYLCKSFDFDDTCNRLVQTAYDESKKVGTLLRIRSLRVLLQIATPETIVKFANLDDVRKYLVILYHVLDCENMRIPLSIKDLVSFRKEEFVRSLWVSRGNETLVQMLMCNMLLDFKLYGDLQLWKNLIERLFKDHNYGFLVAVFLEISAIPSLSLISGLAERWIALVLRGLELVKENKMAFEKCTKLIEMCPFFGLLDWAEVSSEFELWVQTDSTRENGLLGLYKLSQVGFMNETFMSKLNSLPSGEYLPLVKLVVKIAPDYVENAILLLLFDIINEKSLHKVFVAEKELSMMYVQYLISVDRLDGVISNLVAAGMKHETTRIISLYNDKWKCFDTSKDLLQQFTER